jgi:hypothetical protein
VRLGEGTTPAVGEDEGQAVAEGQEDGEAGIAFLERGQGFAAAASRLGRIGIPAVGLREGLGAELEDLPLVLLYVEKDAAGSTRARELGGQTQVGSDRGEVLEPAEVAGRDVDAQEELPEADRPQGTEILECGGKLLADEAAASPELPGERAASAVRTMTHAEDTPVEG